MGKKRKLSKLDRQENKRRKLAALMTVSELNDGDRLKRETFKHGWKLKKDGGRLDADEHPQLAKEETPKVVTTTKNKNRKDITDMELAELKKLYRERCALKFVRPNMRLNEYGMQSSIENPLSSRRPLFLSDVQHFLIYSQHQHHTTGNIPRWVKLDRSNNLNKTIFLIIEGVSLNDYTKNRVDWVNASSFEYKLEIISPLSYGGSLIEEMATFPLTKSQVYKYKKRYGSLKEASLSQILSKVIRTIYPIEDFANRLDKKEEKPLLPPSADAFPRTDLMMTPWQMIQENYPIPMTGILKKQYEHYVYTKDTYYEVSDNSPLWAMDCEMCMTTKGSELTRISIVDESGMVVYHTLVKPYNPITNYLTQFSGIHRGMLDNVWTRLEDVQQKIKEILPPDVILVGHSLSNDLHAVQMMHPYIIDTSLIFNLTGNSSMKSKLRVLAAQFLGKNIQCEKSGHDPTEDALASLQLVKVKLEHSISWGNALMEGVMPKEMLLAAHQFNTAREEEKKKMEECRINNRNGLDFKKVTIESTVGKSYKEMAHFESIYMSLILHHLTRNEKSVYIIGKKNEVDNYSRFIPPQMTLGTPKCPVKVKALPTNKAVVKHGRNLEFKGVTLMHVIVKTHTKADHLIGKLLKLVKEGEDKDKNVLVSVFLAGKESDTIPAENTGLLLVHLFKKFVPPIRLKKELETNAPTA